MPRADEDVAGAAGGELVRHGGGDVVDPVEVGGAQLLVGELGGVHADARGREHPGEDLHLPLVRNRLGAPRDRPQQRFGSRYAS